MRTKRERYETLSAAVVVVGCLWRCCFFCSNCCWWWCCCCGCAGGATLEYLLLTRYARRNKWQWNKTCENKLICLLFFFFMYKTKEISNKMLNMRTERVCEECEESVESKENEPAQQTGQLSCSLLVLIKYGTIIDKNTVQKEKHVNSIVVSG